MDGEKEVNEEARSCVRVFVCVRVYALGAAQAVSNRGYGGRRTVPACWPRKELFLEALIVLDLPRWADGRLCFPGRK